ncbi:MAG: hypothetical protein OXM02_00680, partial [Bacteroidota bacterium]|nr:hypothetical protein [Bacteroidota bacterium]
MWSLTAGTDVVGAERTTKKRDWAGEGGLSAHKRRPHVLPKSGRDLLFHDDPSGTSSDAVSMG